jgi:hypothetical protein
MPLVFDGLQRHHGNLPVAGVLQQYLGVRAKGCGTTQGFWRPRPSDATAT